jgi:hypothetical protein
MRPVALLPARFVARAPRGGKPQRRTVDTLPISPEEAVVESNPTGPPPSVWVLLHKGRIRRPRRLDRGGAPVGGGAA